MTFGVLHFALDEKVIPLIQDLFEEALPGQNVFRIHSDAGRLQHVRPAPNVAQVSQEYFHSRDVQADLRRCQCLVVHAMTPHVVPAIRAAPDTVLVLWSGWGFDYADLLEAQLGALVLPQTRRLFRGRTTLDRARYLLTTTSRVAKIKRKVLRSMRAPRRQRHPLVEVADRIDLFSVTPGEIELVRKAVPQLRAQYHMLVYATTEDTLAVGPARMSGPDILVGNSATPTNNHAEAFGALRRLDLGGRRIVVPLNYGSPAYADAVCRLGKRHFGNAFMPLRTFMPLAEYNELQRNCGTVVMNHRRQQAVGTVSTALYKGARVFLRPESPVYAFYSGMGIALSSTDDMAAHPVRALEPLEAGLQERNRALLGEFLGRDRAVDSIRKLRSYAPRAGAT